MGATHVINHKENLLEQVKALDLDVDIKYTDAPLNFRDADS